MRLLAVLLPCLVAASAGATDLSYQWKKGDVHRFSYEDEATFDLQMNGMPAMPGMPGAGAGKGTMKVHSTFSEKVLAVQADGSADIELTVEQLDVFQGDTKVAALTKLPKSARVTRANVDKKGHAKFFEMVTVYIQDDQVYVGTHKVAASGKVGKNSASASGEVDGVKVEVKVAVNPKTGAVTAAYSKTEKAPETVPPALKKVEVKKDAQKVDVVPKQIFEMMVLPEGELTAGGKAEVETPFGKISTTLVSLEKGVAKLDFALAGKPVTAEATAPAPAEEAAPGMPAMPGMPGMPGMPANPGAKPAAATGAGMQMDVNVHLVFDTAQGKLLGLEGTLDQDMSMGGMGSMKVHSTPKITRL